MKLHFRHLRTYNFCSINKLMEALTPEQPAEVGDPGLFVRLRRGTETLRIHSRTADHCDTGPRKQPSLKDGLPVISILKDEPVVGVGKSVAEKRFSDQPDELIVQGIEGVEVPQPGKQIDQRLHTGSPGGNATVENGPHGDVMDKIRTNLPVEPGQIPNHPKLISQRSFLFQPGQRYKFRPNCRISGPMPVSAAATATSMPASFAASAKGVR